MEGILKLEGGQVDGSPSSLTTSASVRKFDGPCYLKCLVTDAVAGSLIGRNGTEILTLQEKSGCAMRLSAQTSFFPNSSWRVVVISGGEAEIASALETILLKTRERQNAICGDNSNNIQSRLVAPKSAISSIIGTNGQAIKELQHRTKTRIQISQREEGSNERIVTVSGQTENVFKASREVAWELQNDKNLKEIINVVYKFTPTANIIQQYPIHLNETNSHTNSNTISNQQNQLSQTFYQQPYAAYVSRPAFNPTSFPNYEATLLDGNTRFQRPTACKVIKNIHCKIGVKVPEFCLRMFHGKRKNLITEIQNLTGGRIDFTSKNPDNNTENNKYNCTISGALTAVHSAHHMLLERIDTIANNK